MIKLNKKTRIIITSLYVLSLIFLIIGTTYSFFTTTKIANIKPTVKTSTASTNYILFTVENSIEIYPNAGNFKIGGENLSSSVKANVSFTHSASDPSTSEKYDLFLNIESNSLTYSTESKTPELLLLVTGPNNEKLTSIDGLQYVTVLDGQNNEVSGFDITTKTGKINIAKDAVIESATAGTNVVHDWTITVTYVNLGEDQNNNNDKELTGKVQVQRAVLE